MFSITLKDGSKKEFTRPITSAQLAESISPSLLKKSCIARVNGELWDMSRELPHNAQVELLTKDDPEVLEIIRHDTAHVLAEAVKALYKDVQVTIGPAIDDGFYYDFHKKEPFRPEDLLKIEKKMKEIVEAKKPFLREEWSRDKAVKHFTDIGEEFKVEVIKDIPADQTLTVYRQGDFLDLCRGPHLPHTGFVGTAFKLTKIAGAYWRGNAKNPMLQRIYGTAWATQEQLDDYLHMLEEAEKRDHRKLGPQLDLFHLQDEAPGAVFWHPKGWFVYRTIQNYIRNKLEPQGYQEVNTPQIVAQSLWDASGHTEKFYENMFVIPNEPQNYVVKPMNCPCHVQIFKQGLKSYKDLPLRMAEFGSCHRNEPTGALHGIMRVRAFTQDDAHIFCTEEQINSEVKKFCGLLKEVYHDFGFDDFYVKFSDRPEKRAGSDATWDKAEQALKDATHAAGLDFTLNQGEGAFYGPKLEFVLRDSLKREWQCGTIQVDFVLPERLDAHYVDHNGDKVRPVMLHRAILGSFERFIGILIEHYAGKLPLWLAPTQVAICNVNEEVLPYVDAVHKELEKSGLRVMKDISSKTISYKVRDHSTHKIPYILVIGKNEMQDKTVTVRTLGEQKTDVLALDEFIQKIQKQILAKAY
ncbi:MAG: threonine--tRNA ligase [Alphaproteobacteria bacterium]|nr:MAG: threonine--tRNA ligase [Alphaproteobacteria bacterium]